jgi:hypothetical protein
MMTTGMKRRLTNRLKDTWLSIMTSMMIKIGPARASLQVGDRPNMTITLKEAHLKRLSLHLKMELTQLFLVSLGLLQPQGLTLKDH